MGFSKKFLYLLRAPDQGSNLKNAVNKIGACFSREREREKGKEGNQENRNKNKTKKGSGPKKTHHTRHSKVNV